MEQSSLTKSVCPCCKCMTRAINYNGQYLEYYCDNCDHVWFRSCDDLISQDVYENSSKYHGYYVGKPPYLWYHKKAIKYLLCYHTNSRILDFGCFDGFFTKRLLDEGLDAFGCDWNRKALDRGRRKFDLYDRLTSNPEGTCDVIVALEVIEHFEDPNDFLDIVLNYFGPSQKGTLILSCPNKNSLYRPKTDAPPHHFSRFSKSSLSMLLKRRGFTISEYDYEMSSFQLMRNLLGDFLRNDVSDFDNHSDGGMEEKVSSILKLFANSISRISSIAFLPIDSVLYSMRFAYFSQFIVVKR